MWVKRGGESELSLERKGFVKEVFAGFASLMKLSRLSDYIHSKWV